MASPSSSKYPITPSDPPPSSIPESLPYDVFLSFRGSDTRNNFTGHLYDRLVMTGIHTFMDDPELRRGREISLQLMRAIEESRRYIVVFSRNYASSKWCLDELVKIMYCHEKSRRVVLPVFYRVDPYEVRWQQGSFAETFENHEEIYATELNKVNTWRDALDQAASISGFDLQTSALGEVSHKPTGLVRLQEPLISELVKGREVKVDNVDRGIEMIRERFRFRKVLIVLDDLDKESQLDALAGHRDWFGGGSVIIITTRDQHLLTQVQVDGRYEAKQLNKDEALELFSWHSFKKGFPEEPYAVIAEKIVAYSCGLPLALVVLGSYLLGRPIQQWNSAFESLQRIPDKGIQQILKISYDGLDNDEQREIFLDIACFFIGMDIDWVTEILNGCDFNTDIGIGILIERCLLTVDRNNELRMHGLLRDMGREIIREPFPKEPGKRSRLWSPQDVINVLTRIMGTEAIEGITLVSPVKEEIHLNTLKFVSMQRLRLLHMDNVNLNGNFKHLSKVIKWISWLDCPLEHLPSTLQMENLVALDMKHGKMTTVLQGNDILGHLKILDLSHSKCLTSTPDFTRIPSLVTLILEGCTSLIQIDPSIGSLNSLFLLNLKGCEKITELPRELWRLTSLGFLNLSGCSNLKELPQNIGNMDSLRDLYADGTVITCLPFSLRDLTNLTSLSLRGCTKMSGNADALLSFAPYPFTLHSIRRLNLRDCNLSDEDIPKDMGHQSRLKELDLAGNRLSKLPSSFEGLVNLESLWLDDWSILQSIPRLPPNLEALMAKNIHAAT